MVREFMRRSKISVGSLVSGRMYSLAGSRGYLPPTACRCSDRALSGTLSWSAAESNRRASPTLATQCPGFSRTAKVSVGVSRHCPSPSFSVPAAVDIFHADACSCCLWPDPDRGLRGDTGPPGRATPQQRWQSIVGSAFRFTLTTEASRDETWSQSGSCLFFHFLFLIIRSFS